MTDLIAHVTAKLDEQAAALADYLQKRQTAKASDSFSYQFGAMDTVRNILNRGGLSALNPFELDAVTWLNADIESKRRILAIHSGCHECVADGGNTAWYENEFCDTVQLLALAFEPDLRMGRAW